MKTRALLIVLLAATCLAGGGLGGAPTQAQAVDRICTFETNDAHYATLTSPPEHLVIQWHTATNAVEAFQWNHGSAVWFPYALDPGTVTQDFNYNLLDLGITTTGFEATRYSIKGYIATNIQLPAVTFAGIYEGTGTAWFVAHGSLTCVDAVSPARVQRSMTPRR